MGIGGIVHSLEDDLRDIGRVGDQEIGKHEVSEELNASQHWHECDTRIQAGTSKPAAYWRSECQIPGFSMRSGNTKTFTIIKDKIYSRIFERLYMIPDLCLIIFQDKGLSSQVFTSSLEICYISYGDMGQERKVLNSSKVSEVPRKKRAHRPLRFPCKK